MRDHNRTLSIIFLVFGALKAFAWFAIGGIFGGEWMLLVFATFYLLAGINMLNNKPSAKTFGVIASLISLFGFPIGTAVGIYGMWYFLYSENESF